MKIWEIGISSGNCPEDVEDLLELVEVHMAELDEVMKEIIRVANHP